MCSVYFYFNFNALTVVVIHKLLTNFRPRISLSSEPLATELFLPRVAAASAGHGLLILEVSRGNTTTHHSQYNCFGGVISSSQSSVLENTRQSGHRRDSNPQSRTEDPQTHALHRSVTGTG
jgi:hypothetical protein